MRAHRADLIVPCLLILASFAGANGALAQSSSTEPLKAAAPSLPPLSLSPAPDPTPALKSPAAPAAPVVATAPAGPIAVTAPAPPVMTAKELEGLDVFGSEGQQIGKVIKVAAAPDGKVNDVVVQTKGFLSLFKKTYVIPADKLTKRGGRIDVSMTSEQVKLLVK